jgi:hypothetical protein
LRGILKVQGVVGQLKPFEVFTEAPSGVDFTAKSVCVPLVTVAQPLSATAKPTTDAQSSARRSEEVEIVIVARPPGPLN